MNEDDWETEATLWLAAEPCAQGPFRECLKRWNDLPQWERAKAYIEVVRPVGFRRVFRTDNLYGLDIPGIYGRAQAASPVH